MNRLRVFVPPKLLRQILLSIFILAVLHHPWLALRTQAGDLPGVVASLPSANPQPQAPSSAVDTLFPPDLSEKLGRVQPLLPMVYLGLRSFAAFPTLLGIKTPRTYLILVQNNHELRPTGGFISALGLVTVDKTRITRLDFLDSYSVFREDVEYPLAPQPMQRFMGIYYLTLRDGNWSPDLPTTAQLVRSLYFQDMGVRVDGVITIDLVAAELLIGALEPLSLPGAPEPLMGATIIEQLQAFWTKPLATGETIESVGLSAWWGQRKDFIPTLANAVLDKLRSGSADYVRLLQALQKALDTRAIQIWVDEPTTAGELARLGWDGRLQLESGADFVGLVETNMGYNKVNAVLQRTLRYEVAWPADPGAPALATATITYTHPLQLPDFVCNPAPLYGNDYNDLIERCYFSYVRLYTPTGSELIGIDGLQPDSIQTQRSEGGSQVFGGYFVLPPGQQQVIRFVYQLPRELIQANYRLIVQRQAGSGPLPLTITIGNHTETRLLTHGKLTWEQ